MAKNTDQSFEHDYDGIQEYDNPLPRWWVWLFIGTVVFAAAYVPFYHFGPGALPEEAHVAEMREWNRLHPPKSLPGEDELRSIETSDLLASGKSVYATRCAACHAVDGGGQVGPNLTDDYALHGYSREQILKVVHDGVPVKGMIAWGELLSSEELYAVSLYVYNLRGQPAANPKAPQGEVIPVVRGSGDGGTPSE